MLKKEEIVHLGKNTAEEHVASRERRFPKMAQYGHGKFMLVLNKPITRWQPVTSRLPESSTPI